MISHQYKHIISMAVSAMLIISIAMGQSSFQRDSLQKVISSDTDQQSKLQAMAVMANEYLNQGLFDSCILFCDQAISIAISGNNISRQAELNIIKGKALFYSQGPALSIVSYKESYKLYSSIGDSSGIASALNGMGVMFQKMGHTDSSLACYIQLVTIAEKNDYEQVLGKGYVNMGILYVLMDEYDKGGHYLDLSIPINEKYSANLVALAQMNKGLIYDGEGKVDSAFLMFRQALAVYKHMPASKRLADLYNNMGTLFYLGNENDSAAYYYTKAKEIYEGIGDWYTFCQVYHNLAQISHTSGEHIQALTMLDSCIVLAKSKRNIELEADACRSKHRVYTSMGDYKNALRNYLKFDSLHQILYNMEKEELMADMEMKYQNEKMQAQNIALERDNLKKSKQNNIYLFTGIGIIAFITFAFLYFRQRAEKDKIIARQRIQQLEEEKKLLAARSLVEGQEEERKRIAREIHDGLGVLLSTTRMQFSTIGITSPEALPIIEKASKLLEQASNDVRKISHNMMPGLLTKLGLYEAVEDLFEKISETEGLEVHTDIPEEMERLPENREIMVYRIIQELVNNTIKHAGAKSIRISMLKTASQLEVFYSDDGKGFKIDEQQDSKSIGLASIQSRVNFLNGKMDLQSEPGQGVSFKLWVPC